MRALPADAEGEAAVLERRAQLLTAIAELRHSIAMNLLERLDECATQSEIDAIGVLVDRANMLVEAAGNRRTHALAGVAGALESDLARIRSQSLPQLLQQNTAPAGRAT